MCHLTRNEASRDAATHLGERWTPEQDAYLAEHWHATEQTEEEIARHLGRTIESCRVRLSIQRHGYHSKPAKPRSAKADFVAVCEECWTALPATGQCDNCEGES